MFLLVKLWQRESSAGRRNLFGGSSRERWLASVVQIVTQVLIECVIHRSILRGLEIAPWIKSMVSPNMVVGGREKNHPCFPVVLHLPVWRSV